METINQKIESLKTNKYRLTFEEVFNTAFENYKKIAVYAGFTILVFSFLLVILCAVGLILFVGVEHLNPNSIKQLEIQMLKPEYIGYQFAIVLFINCLFCPIGAGFLKMAQSAEKDIEFKIPMLLYFFKWSYYKELFVATFIITVLSTGIDSVLVFYKIPIVGSVLSFVFAVLTILSTPLIVFGNLKAIPALKASVSLANQQLMVIFLLLIVAFLGSLVGLIGFCIGIFFTIPFQTSMQYAIYNTIIGLETEELAAVEIKEN